MAFVGKEAILGTAERLDGIVAGLCGHHLHVDRPNRVTAFLFHRFFLEGELAADPLGVFPHERVTVDRFAAFLALCRKNRFTFALPRDVAAGRASGKSIMITVDDGYADNLRLLDLLERYDARAVLFVSPANVIEQKRFWPDAISIGAARSGLGQRMLARLLRRVTTMPHTESVPLLQSMFGADIFRPEGELDRPLTVAELKTLAASPRIEIGVHGYEHTVLAPRSPAFVDRQVGRAATELEEIIGYRPTAIAYPNGVWSDALVTQCAELGFTTGMTIEARNNSLSDWATPRSALQLGRFTFSGRRPAHLQLQSTQLDRSLMQFLYRRKKSKVALEAA